MQFGDDKNPDIQAHLPLMIFEPEGDLRQLWSVQVGDRQGKRYTRLRPALVDDTLFVADAYGLVEARALSDGELRGEPAWGVPEQLGIKLNFLARDNDNGSFVTGGVGADAYTVLLGTRDGVVHALRADDENRFGLRSCLRNLPSPPAVNRDLVLVLTSDGPVDGAESFRWDAPLVYDTQVPVLTYEEAVRLSSVAASPLGALRAGALSLCGRAMGECAGENAAGSAHGRSELERIADVDSTPLLKGGVVFVVGYRGAVKALRLRMGKRLGASALELPGALAGYGAVFVTDDAGSYASIRMTAW